MVNFEKVFGWSGTANADGYDVQESVFMGRIYAEEHHLHLDTLRWRLRYCHGLVSAIGSLSFYLLITV